MKKVREERRVQDAVKRQELVDLKIKNEALGKFGRLSLMRRRRVRNDDSRG